MTIREPLEYDAFLPHRTVMRLRRVDGMPPTLIEKVTEGPATASPYLVDNARRELEAYRSGLLDDLGPAVRAPRLLHSEVDADGRITLLLEELHHEGGRPLDGSALVAAARDLGTMAGRWLGRVPDEPWLFRDWIFRHTQPPAYHEGREVLARRDPAVVRVLGAQRLADASELIDAQPRLRELLEALPDTLCHHDAVGANVFRIGGTTGLIDWESVGPGPAGADLASLLFASARRGDASAAVVDAVLPDAVTAYADGLRSQGADLDDAAVRLGFDAAVGLRWKLARDVAATVERGEPAHRGSAPHESPEQALRELVELVDVLLACSRRALSAR